MGAFYIKKTSGERMPQNIFKIFDGRTNFWHSATTKNNIGNKPHG